MFSVTGCTYALPTATEDLHSDANRTAVNVICNPVVPPIFRVCIEQQHTNYLILLKALHITGCSTVSTVISGIVNRLLGRGPSQLSTAVHKKQLYEILKCENLRVLLCIRRIGINYAPAPYCQKWLTDVWPVRGLYAVAVRVTNASATSAHRRQQ